MSKELPALVARGMSMGSCRVVSRQLLFRMSRRGTRSACAPVPLCIPTSPLGEAMWVRGHLGSCCPVLRRRATN